MYKAKSTIFDIYNPEIRANAGQYVVIEDKERLDKALALGLIEEVKEESKDFVTFVKAETEKKEEAEKKAERKTTKK